MFRFFIFVIIFCNFFITAFADYENADPYSKEVLREYKDCEYQNSKKKHYTAIKYDLEEYIPSYTNTLKETSLTCNKVLEKIFNNKKINFDNLLNVSVSKNESRYENLYIHTYLLYHKNIIWNSDDVVTIKKSINEIEKNYLNKSDLNINTTAVSIVGTLGWFYNTKVKFADFVKAHDYLLKTTKFYKSEYSLGFAFNNLGVVYDMDRYKNNSKKKNNKIAFDLYSKAVKYGNYHAYSNLSKFYLLGLGGVKKDYEKTIKNYKFARISSHGNNDFSQLNILYIKKRLPKNLNEYLMWLEEYLINNQDSEVFLHLAWLLDENENENKTTSGDYQEIYKWHYLCSKHCIHYIDRERSSSELHILKKFSLSKQQINKSISNAKKWQKKYWNKPIKKTENKNIKKEKKALADIIINAFMRK